MIKIKEDHMLTLNPEDDLFRYLSSGTFITEIFSEEGDFNKVF